MAIDCRIVNATSRRQLLDMARRRAGPGSGSALGVVKDGRSCCGSEVQLPDLGGIRFAIVGGLATARYMPERMTLDTDILIAADDLAAVEKLLERGGCEKIGPLCAGGSTWRLPGGRTLDVLALRQGWVHEALDSVGYDERGRPFIDLPFLVAMKLESGRLQDLADISRMLGFADEGQLTRTRALVSRLRPQDSVDLESMIQLGKLEHEQAGGRGGR